MRTPFGQECSYFFGDYFRGRNFEECRLLTDSESKKKWSSKLCKSCPVPGIIQANSCKNMQLSGIVKNDFGFIKRMNISAYCAKSKQKVKEPHVGCGQCHPLPNIYLEGK